MRLILSVDWLHTLAEELLDHDYRSEYPDIDNYDVIAAIITGMVDDVYFDVHDPHIETRWRAHVQARLLELFRTSYLNQRTFKRSDGGFFPEHLKGLTRELSDLPSLPRLYRYIWRMLAGQVVEVKRVEFPNDRALIINLQMRDHKRRVYA